ncbi:MAG: AmmeMemoRadiSam system protein B [Candidatus Altiarchaeota archaeon]|nr:AmmeMemoRadiSam system protein B [Candidatus Altiarchaeota archaeon]
MNSGQLRAILLGGVLFIAFIFLIFRGIPEESTTMERNLKEQDFAGSWYPADREELNSMLDSYLEKADKEELNLQALICAHAGYMASGQTAAYSYKQLEGSRFKRAIILAGSHSHPIRGGVISNYTHFSTPFGELAVSPLKLEHPLLEQNNFPFLKENALEMQLPLLKKVMPNIEIIPIILGQLNKDEVQELAKFISSLLDNETVLLTSTDFSHHHPYDEAVEMDKQSIKSILALDSESTAKGELCGAVPVLITIEVAKLRGWDTKLLHYENSGDVLGDMTKVVGYAAIAFHADWDAALQAQESTGEAGESSSGQKESPGTQGETVEAAQEDSPDLLTPEEQQYLLSLARDTIEEYVRNNKTLEPSTDNPRLKEKRSAFVTLEKDGQLRGCIGHIQAVQELYLDVRDNAISAAVHDTRFPAVTAEELESIKIEVSVLTTPESITADEIQPGTDGIILEAGTYSATYLPQVWEQIPEKEDFLTSLCKKAGVPVDC